MRVDRIRYIIYHRTDLEQLSSRTLYILRAISILYTIAFMSFQFRLVDIACKRQIINLATILFFKIKKIINNARCLQSN